MFTVFPNRIETRVSIYNELSKKKQVQSVPIAALCLYNIQRENLVFKNSLCSCHEIKWSCEIYIYPGKLVCCFYTRKVKSTKYILRAPRPKKVSFWITVLRLTLYVVELYYNVIDILIKYINWFPNEQLRDLWELCWQIKLSEQQVDS